ncbi:MAG: cell division protein ZipA [Hahellaceae bacterium]|nr:cell division protein ZipA [Hahellaceae bacterium]
MNFRDWLIVAGLVVLVLIVLDGLRRMHRARKDSLEIARGMGGQMNGSPLDDFNPELPNGGARIVNPLVEEGANTEYAQRDDLLGESSLDEPVDSSEMRLSAHDDRDENVIELHSEPRKVGSLKTATKIDSPRHSKSFGEGLKPTNKRDKPTGTPKTPDGNKRKINQEILVINVFSRSADGFNCGDLFNLFDACGLEFGDMSIFHRHEEADTESPVQFSVANAVVPGNFSVEDMDESYTPGVSFFMSLPGPTDNMLAFECMLATAQCVVKNLDGEMKDEQRSDMTIQTVEHCRQRIKDFERKQLSIRR